MFGEGIWEIFTVFAVAWSSQGFVEVSLTAFCGDLEVIRANTTELRQDILADGIL